MSKRDFKASSSELWSILEEPAYMPAWNEKRLRCDPLNGATEGSRFSIVFQLKGKASTAMGELLRRVPDREIAFRYHFGTERSGGSIDESFKIKPLYKNRRTRVIHTVDFRHSSLPSWVKVLIRIIGKVGHPLGPNSLEGIDALLPDPAEASITPGLPNSLTSPWLSAK